MPDVSKLSITRDRTLLLTAAGGSLLVSCWLLLTNEVINRDGVRYVTAAEALVAGNLQSAFDAFPWPFHAGLMAALHMVTGWSLETCGYALIPPLHLIVVFAFLAILRELGGTRPVLWAGLALVLLHPGLNDTLPGILRDQGYWAFWLLSLLYFIRFFKHHRWRDAAAWTLCAVASLLFRIEGLVFLLLMPLAMLANAEDRWTVRLVTIARAYTPVLCLAGAAIVVSALLGRDVLMLDEGRIAEPLQRAQNLWTSIVHDIAGSGRELGDALLPRYSRNHGPTAMWMVLLYIAAIESLRAMHLLYVALAAATCIVRRFTPDSRVMPVLWWVIALNAILIGGFVLSEFYLSARYAAALTLTVMLMASFGLASLWLNARERVWATWRGRLLFPTVVTALLIIGVAGLVSIGPRKFHERVAGQWVLENIPMHTPIYFDDIRTEHYAGRHYAGGTGHDWLHVRDMLQKGRLDDYEVLVLHFSRRRPERLVEAQDLIGSAPLQRFENNRGDSIAVFRRPTDEADAQSAD